MLFHSSWAGAEPRFVQDRFCISFFVDPPIDEEAPLRYKEIAEANFNVVMGTFGAKTPQELRKQVKLCAKNDLACIIHSAGLPDEDLPTDKHVWGYFVRDEPAMADFPAVKERVDALRAAHPGKMAYVNLFPSYCDAERLGTESYDEHVRKFVETVQPEVLCMDHYPFMTPTKDTRDAYLGDLAVMRKHALLNEIPWWNFFNTMPFGPHYDPTEAQLRWQIFSSVAYGARGVLYFCYWTPKGAEFPRGGAILTAEGKKTRHYDQAKRINATLKVWGPHLMRMIPTWSGRFGAKGDDGGAILSISEGDYVLGLLQHEDHRRGVVLVNHDTAYTIWPTVEFDVTDEKVNEVDRATGAIVPAIDDSPDVPGLQLSLDAGDARLFILPEHAERAKVKAIECP